jgi:hypothetical protein
MSSHGRPTVRGMASIAARYTTPPGQQYTLSNCGDEPSGASSPRASRTKCLGFEMLGQKYVQRIVEFKLILFIRETVAFVFFEDVFHFHTALT